MPASGRRRREGPEDERECGDLGERGDLGEIASGAHGLARMYASERARVSHAAADMTSPALRRPRIFRDPVHGDIAFPRGPFQRLLESIIDTEMFQRLRGIRQTAVMNLVFHGAEHSRFAHSMGAAHVAGRMVDAAATNSGGGGLEGGARGDGACGAAS